LAHVLARPQGNRRLPAETRTARLSAGQARTEAAPETATTTGTKVLLGLFLLTLLLPIFFHLGDLRLSPYRLFLLVAFVPLLLHLLAGKAGRIAPGDIFIGLHCLWVGLALIAVHGTGRVPFAGITVAETMGGYLVGRVLIRNASDYRTFFRYFTIGLVVLAPFVVVEMLTARAMINEFFAPVVSTFPKVFTHEQRMGLYRAQAVFEHPILFGVFCSVAIANLFFIFRQHLAKSILLSGFATVMTFASLSSAALLAAALQFGMIAWGWITRNAWWMLVGLGVMGYIVVDMASNRTPITILLNYVTFSPHNAWIRIHIWNFGMAEVWRNPLFGIGLNDWRRPGWLGSSVDNFWLVVAMRYGIPGFLLLVLGICGNLFQIMRHDLPEAVKPYRLGYVFAGLGLFMTLATVHVWGATAVLFMFYVGAGTWMFNGSLGESTLPEDGMARQTRQRRDRHRADPSQTALASGDDAGNAGRGARDRAAVLARRRAAYGQPRS
jgi:hypothetical protein